MYVDINHDDIQNFSFEPLSALHFFHLSFSYVDIPLSYGVYDVCNDPNNIHMCEFLWDPTNETGVFIRVSYLSKLSFFFLLIGLGFIFKDFLYLSFFLSKFFIVLVMCLIFYLFKCYVLKVWNNCVIFLFSFRNSWTALVQSSRPKSMVEKKELLFEYR